MPWRAAGDTDGHAVPWSLWFVTLRAAVAQEVELVVHEAERQWFDPRLLQSAFRSVLGQDTQPQIAPDSSCDSVMAIVSYCLTTN